MKELFWDTNAHRTEALPSARQSFQGACFLGYSAQRFSWAAAIRSLVLRAVALIVRFPRLNGETAGLCEFAKRLSVKSLSPRVEAGVDSLQIAYEVNVSRCWPHEFLVSSNHRTSQNSDGLAPPPSNDAFIDAIVCVPSCPPHANRI